MRAASALGGFVSLTDEESFAVEYWPLELYKLTLAPPPRELQGHIALITGGAGGIGRAVAAAVAAEGDASSRPISTGRERSRSPPTSATGRSASGPT